MRGSEGSLVDVALRKARDPAHPGAGLGDRLAKDMHEEGWKALLTSLFAAL